MPSLKPPLLTMSKESTSIFPHPLAVFTGDIQSQILSFCSAEDLIRYASVNKEAHKEIQAYITTKFLKEFHTHRFFKSDTLTKYYQSLKDKIPENDPLSDTQSLYTSLSFTTFKKQMEDMQDLDHKKEFFSYILYHYKTLAASDDIESIQDYTELTRSLLAEQNKYRRSFSLRKEYRVIPPEINMLQDLETLYQNESHIKKYPPNFKPLKIQNPLWIKSIRNYNTARIKSFVRSDLHCICHPRLLQSIKKFMFVFACFLIMCSVQSYLTPSKNS